MSKVIVQEIRCLFVCSANFFMMYNKNKSALNQKINL